MATSAPSPASMRGNPAGSGTTFGSGSGPIPPSPVDVPLFRLVKNNAESKIVSLVSAIAISMVFVAPPPFASMLTLNTSVRPFHSIP